LKKRKRYNSKGITNKSTSFVYPFKPSKVVLQMLKARGIINIRNNRIRKGMSFNQIVNKAMSKFIIESSGPDIKELALKMEILEMQRERDKLETSMMSLAEELREIKRMRKEIENESSGKTKDAF